MFKKPHRQVALWLLLSAGLLSTLIPGGPIENRDFSHIHGAVLGVFNVFLTTLDLGSVVIAYFAFRQRGWAYSAAFVAAVSYFAVYAVDLAQIFPRSPTPMSFALALVEVLGMTVAVPLMFSVRKAMETVPERGVSESSVRARFALASVLVLAGLGIVWFATDAAMGRDVEDSLATEVSSQAAIEVPGGAGE